MRVAPLRRGAGARPSSARDDTDVLRPARFPCPPRELVRSPDSVWRCLALLGLEGVPTQGGSTMKRGDVMTRTTRFLTAALVGAALTSAGAAMAQNQYDPQPQFAPAAESAPRYVPIAPAPGSTAPEAVVAPIGSLS